MTALPLSLFQRMDQRMTKSPDDVWTLIKDIPMALLVTKDGDRLDARPMGATAKPG